MSTVLTIPRHQQNNDHYCGPACAQMVLDSLGIDPAQHPQLQLFDECHIRPNWNASPDALRDTLNAIWDDALGLRFRLYVCELKEDLLVVVTQNIEERVANGHPAPPLVVTMQDDHWVAVTGFETDAACADATSPVIGLHLQNPLPPRTTGLAEEDHWTGDHCVHGAMCIYMGLATWERDMATGVREDDPPAWQGRYLAICLEPGGSGNDDEVWMPATRVVPATPVANRDRILSRDEIAEHVAVALECNPWGSHACVTEVMAHELDLGPILLVVGLTGDGRIDEANAYYLVPFLRQGGAFNANGGAFDGTVVSAVGIFDAYTGELQEIYATPEGTVFPSDWLVADTINGRSDANRITPRPSDRNGDEFPFTLVWRSSTASPLRCRPLILGDRDRGDGTTEQVYMDTDGGVHTAFERLHA